MKYPPIQVVNERDEPLYGATLDEIRKKGLWYRVVRVTVEDDQGRLLLQKRSQNVLTLPGCWDTSAAGHVDEGEDYLAAARRELAEEIGLQRDDLDEIEYHPLRWVYQGLTLRGFSKTYRVEVQSGQKFIAAPDEVEELRWFTRAEIAHLLKEHPELITDGLKHLLKLYL